jgi:hypothetical protein
VAKDKGASCPSCGKNRDVEKQSDLRRVELAWFEQESRKFERGSPFYPLEDGMRRLARSVDRRWFWACDECIHSGRALPANIAKQNLGVGTPLAAYVDRPFRCDDCGRECVFSAQEQRHWFEKLGFLIWVSPKQCPECRRKRRMNKRTHASLAEALHGLDPHDAAQLEAVARLYDALGRSERATEYRARARNRRPKSSK